MAIALRVVDGDQRLRGLIDRLRAEEREVNAAASLDGRLPSLIETTSDRPVQEALTSVTKHAQATPVTVLLQQEAQEIRCSIRENGVGFDVPAVLAGRAGPGAARNPGASRELRGDAPDHLRSWPRDGALHDNPPGRAGVPLRVLLADDHAIVRYGLKALLEREGLEVVGEGADGHGALRLARDLSPDVAVLDLAMPLLNGIDAAQEIVRASPRTRTILLTMHTEDHQVVKALQAGIKGYVVKTQAAEDLLQAIREVSRGRTYLSPGISHVVVERYLAKTELPPDPLTPRERQVLQLVAEGKTTKDIARLLGLTVKTAETYRSRIMEKLDIHETASLVRYAIRRGLIQP